MASDASTHTATARSFRELHKRLSQHAQTLEDGSRATSGGHLGDVQADNEEAVDSDIAASFSEGRRTPLPPVMDDEEEELHGTEVKHTQAMFYSPEVPGTPNPAQIDGLDGSKENTPQKIDGAQLEGQSDGTFEAKDENMNEKVEKGKAKGKDVTLSEW